MFGFFGNFGILVRAYVYILSLGRKGLKNISLYAVLNANYLKYLFLSIKKKGRISDLFSNNVRSYF